MRYYGRLVMKPPAIILYNAPDAQPANADPRLWRESVEAVTGTVDSVAAALERLAVPHERAGVRRLSDIPAALRRQPGAPVINLVEGLEGAVADFNHVPAVCLALGHPCTGSPADCLDLTLDKWLTKMRLRAWGIPEAGGAVIPIGTPVDPAALPPLPLMVKPLWSDGSEGINDRSVVRAPGPALAEAVRHVHERSGQPALVEPFIDGREFNLAILERNGRVEALPIAEIDFSLFPAGRPRIVDYAVKWIPGTIPGHISPRRIPAPVDEALAGRLRDAALRAWDACGCRDYIRVDCRVDAAGNPFVLEVNANPDICPKAGYPAALAAAGIAFHEFIGALLENAARRAAGKES